MIDLFRSLSPHTNFMCVSFSHKLCFALFWRVYRLGTKGDEAAGFPEASFAEPTRSADISTGDGHTTPNSDCKVIVVMSCRIELRGVMSESVCWVPKV